MEQSSDEQLAERARDGDLTAFRELVDLHKAYIFTLLFRMIEHRETAEDLAQEVFIKLYRSLPQYRGDAKLSTWLYRIAVNTAADYRRAQSRNPLARFIRQLKETRIDTHDQPEERVVAKEGQELLRVLLARLPEKYKLPLYLYHYKQLSVQEISGITGLPPKTVETRLYRGKTLLRQQWMEANGHEFRSALE